MGTRTTLSALMVSSSLTSPARVTSSTPAVLRSITAPLHMSMVSPLTLTSVTGRIRTTGLYFVSLQSANTMFELNLLESDSQILGPLTFEVTVESGPIPEHNPYRPTVPEELLDQGSAVYDYQRENQEILREQHDLTQAGDSTFPYQMMVQSHSQPHFKLGSLSRFYHEDFGIIICRYVQFDEIAPTGNASCPMGFIKKHGTLDWIVTNNLAKSHPDLIVGISAPYVLPANKTYGWAIVDGPNLQPLFNDSTDFAYGEAFSWSQTGSISNSAKGKVLGRRINGPAAKSILAGQLHIQLESYSLEQISQAVIEATENLSQTVAALQDDVATLSSLTNLDETVAGIQTTLTNLRAAIDGEISTRRHADAVINDRISNLNFVTANQLSTAIAGLQNNLATIEQSLQNSITNVRGIALDALQKANQALAGNLAGLQGQISAILTSLNDLISRPKGKFPLVDGSVPPNLMYLDTGELIYEETF